MTINDRIAEAITRHGPDSPIGQARTDRGAYLLAVADGSNTADPPARSSPTNTPSPSDPPRYWIHLFRMTRQPFDNAIIKAPNDSTPADGALKWSGFSS